MSSWLTLGLPTGGELTGEREGVILVSSSRMLRAHHKNSKTRFALEMLNTLFVLGRFQCPWSVSAFLLHPRSICPCWTPRPRSSLEELLELPPSADFVVAFQLSPRISPSNPHESWQRFMYVMFSGLLASFSCFFFGSFSGSWCWTTPSSPL